MKKITINAILIAFFGVSFFACQDEAISSLEAELPSIIDNPNSELSESLIYELTARVGYRQEVLTGDLQITLEETTLDGLYRVTLFTGQFTSQQGKVSKAYGAFYAINDGLSRGTSYYDLTLAEVNIQGSSQNLTSEGRVLSSNGRYLRGSFTASQLRGDLRATLID